MITDKERLLGGATYRTTGIGSLPHHNTDAALTYSFKYGIPFLPQIPIRNPWEFMIAQALEGLPGLQLGSEAQACLNLDIWRSESHRLDHRLNQAFSVDPNSARIDQAFESFEPSAPSSSSWQPFLWELQEHDRKVAKVQISGPLTSQWSLRLKDQSPADQIPELSTQIFRLVLAKSLALVYRMKSCGIQPILFIDEPGLYAFSIKQPRHLLALQELKLMIQSLKKAGGWVGLHCCSNTHWESILKLGLDFLSLDVQLSLSEALTAGGGQAMADFIQTGGRLCLGIIPTHQNATLAQLDPREVSDGTLEIFAKNWEPHLQLLPQVLREALFTPACGLALHSPSDAELVLEKLAETYESFNFA
ncbi:MAG: hypothetical protein HYX41_06170 [Bdellovibrio sp.]|nr:hypothetical protein [Bdellovibrio sp.]